MGVIDEAPPQERRKQQYPRRAWIAQRSEFWVRLLTLLFMPVMRLWVRYFRWYGVENVPATGPCFLICNHTTGMDPFLIGYSLRHRAIRGPGRIELFKHPVPAYIMRKMGMFPLRQRIADAAAIRTVVELLRGGELVVVFPEGGRSKDGQLQPFQSGFARLAIKLRMPLVPMAIAGGRDLLPIGSYLPRRNTPVVAMYGKPFDLSQFYGVELTQEVLESAAQLMHDRVEDLLAQGNAECRRLATKHHLKPR